MNTGNNRNKILVIIAAIIMVFSLYGFTGLADNMPLVDIQKALAEPAKDDTNRIDISKDKSSPVSDKKKSDSSYSRAKGSSNEGNAKSDKRSSSKKSRSTNNVADIDPLPDAIADDKLNIERVEVLTSPELQAVYRQSVYQGKADNNEDPNKWYTTENTINLRDPRIFTFSFSVPADAVSKYYDGADTQSPEEKETAARNAFLETVKLQYGGHDLDKWGYNSKFDYGSDNDLRGENPIFEITSKSITKNAEGGYNVYIDMRTENPWGFDPSRQLEPRDTNIPYENYGGGRQLYQFSNGQSEDNRWYWQIGPAHKGLGEYEMSALTGDEKIASRKMDIQQYDGSYSWIQMNEFAQSLVKAINGSELSKADIAAQKTGLIAGGYVKMDENGNFISGEEGNGVWVEVSILGYGLTDNDKEENNNYNNYARYNAIWNIVVAQSESKVDEYLDETKPDMNDDPDKLIDKYKNKDPENIDMLNVCYLNNVHPDEISGIDSDIKLISDLIKGGAQGKEIKYYTWEDDDMDLRYRDPADGYQQSYSGHRVKGGYSADKFWNTAARKIKKFDTKEALNNFIFVTNICSNPDAKAGMRRTNRYDIDLNRDGVFTTMPETIALIRDIMKWDPLVLLEWHGYVSNMLIEPCTAPHDPAFDYDLLSNNMLNLTYAAGEAVTANTGYDTFLCPWDHYDAGDWDDGGTIYAPMFSELLGCFGYTIEFPDANSDSYDAGNVIIYAMIDELLHGTCEFYEGNRLNGPLKDKDGNMRDSHENDFLDKSSMRKNTVLSKLETKKRGIENTDSEKADKYFIDKQTVPGDDYKVEDVVVGRARPKDIDGKTLSFYPDFIVIPRGAGQYNFAEGIKGINQMLSWGIKVEKTTKDVFYKGKKIEKGSYVMPMNQAYRNVIFEVMSKGYDATGFSDMYADIYCNLPDVRGFDSIQIYDKTLFDGKTVPQTETIKKVANISGPAGKYIVFKSQSTDAVRFVNHLLKHKADVWMMENNEGSVGTASDYVIKNSDLKLIESLPDKPVIGINGCQIEGHYTASLPKKAKKLVDPVIQFNTERTAQSGGALWYLMDDYLGFNSMANYNGDSKNLRKGANVIIVSGDQSREEFADSWANAVKSGQAGLIMIGNTEGLEKLGIKKPEASPLFADVALNGTYNVDDSLYTANYKNTSTYYARGYSYSDLPEGSKVLFKSLPSGKDAFIGGFQATGGDKSVFGNKVTMFSKVLTGKDYARANQVVVFGQLMEYRAHYQKLLPMLATAIYAGASGIVDKEIPDASPKIIKKANPMTVKGKTVKIKYKKLKKKKQSVKRKKAITIKKNKGSLSFKKISVSKKIKVKKKKSKKKKKVWSKRKKYAAKFKINKKNGKITIKKGTKRGKYKIRVKVRAAGNAYYKAAAKTVSVVIIIK